MVIKINDVEETLFLEPDLFCNIEWLPTLLEVLKKKNECIITLSDDHIMKLKAEDGNIICYPSWYENKCIWSEAYFYNIFNEFLKVLCDEAVEKGYLNNMEADQFILAKWKKVDI